MAPSSDPSHGYDAAAAAFLAARSPTIGVATLHHWAEALPAHASVLDLGCGNGVPLTALLVASGFDVLAIDPSPTLVAAFRSRFPAVPIACEAAEDSPFFHRTFHAVVAWGVLFLLSPDTQAEVIRKVATALRPGGHFLFTAPAAPCQWVDAITGQTSVSLGAEAYRTLLTGAGLCLHGEAEDEGENHYFFARRLVGDAPTV